RVGRALISRLKRIADGQVAGIGRARDVGVARAIERDRAADVRARAAEVCRVSESRATAVQLGHKDVAAAASIRLLVGVHQGEVGRARLSGYVRRAAGIDGDGVANV